MDIRGFFGGGGGLAKAKKGDTTRKSSSPGKVKGKRKQEEISSTATSSFVGSQNNPVSIDQPSAPSKIADASSLAKPQHVTSGTGNVAKRQKLPATATGIVADPKEVPEKGPEAAKMDKRQWMQYMAKKRQDGTLGKTPAGSGAPVTLPKGAPMCLDGKSFVVTGVLPGMDRDKAKDFIKEWGGSVKTAVSGKTDFLVAGEVLEDGRPVSASSKYKKAVDKKVKIIGQDELLEMVASTYKPAAPSTSVSAPSKSSSSSANSEAVRPRSSGGENDADSKAAAQIARDAAKTRERYKKERASRNSNNTLWADKHKPSSVNELLGNGGHVRAITQWLTKWDAWHLHKTEKPPWNKQNPGAKAVLIAGPPGIGKSSAAALIARSMGYEVMELNASDTRSKKLLESNLSDVTQTKVLSFGRQKASSSSSKGSKRPKRLIIMDEVDGMSSGDRGGVAALTAAIKKTKTPIICICNDDQKQSIRSGLARVCYHLKFARPQKGTIVRRLLSIAAKEGMKVEPNALEFLCETTGGDIRQILNAMQMWNQGRNVGDGKDRTLTFANVRQSKDVIGKDEMQRVSVFNAASLLLACPRGTSPFKKRDELFFVDYGIMPLFAHQNYPRSVQSGNHAKNDVPDLLSQCADLVSDTDLYDAYIRGKGRWDLLTKQAATVSGIGMISRGRAQPMFPETLGKMSSVRKSQRLLQELIVHTGGRTQANHRSMRLDYLIPLRDHVMRPLVQNGQDLDAAKECAEIIKEYGLSREDASISLTEFGLVGSASAKVFERLPAKIKGAFTRHFNKTGKVTQGMLLNMKQADVDKLLVKKKASKGKRSSATSGKNKKARR